MKNNDYATLVLIMAAFVTLVVIGCIFPVSTAAFISGVIATAQS